MRRLIWNFYADPWRTKPTPAINAVSTTGAVLDRIFRRRTGFTTLDRLLARLHANKAELGMVVDRPDTPLHTNGSENDIRCQVTRRKISAGTRSYQCCDCRDAFSPRQDLHKAQRSILGLASAVGSKLLISASFRICLSQSAARGQPA